jgi:hypothetical protein
MVQCNPVGTPHLPRNLQLYVAIFLVLTFPYWLLGDVVAP